MSAKDCFLTDCRSFCPSSSLYAASPCWPKSAESDDCPPDDVPEEFCPDVSILIPVVVLLPEITLSPHPIEPCIGFPIITAVASGRTPSITPRVNAAIILAINLGWTILIRNPNTIPIQNMPAIIVP